MRKSIIGFIVLIILTPLGLLAPGSAWGEWGLDEIKEKVGFIPQGMSHFNEVIKNVLPDYGISGFDKNFLQSALGYILSAIVGIAAIALIFWLIAKLVPEKKEKTV
ncbi:MAG TPA: cobalamin biosynthesis protein [Firmicutes bacterium]|jgi:cobalt/nickel transport protein|nr:cobalamin biosynthesis protein [Bacillota bacterium]